MNFDKIIKQTKEVYAKQAVHVLNKYLAPLACGWSCRVCFISYMFRDVVHCNDIRRKEQAQKYLDNLTPEELLEI